MLLSAPVSPAHGGAWTKGESEGEFILNALFFQSDAFFDRQGDKQNQPVFSKYEVNPYVEYGYSDRLTLGANVFLHYIEQDQPNGSTSRENFGIGDPELFARYRLQQGDNWVLSVQPLFKLPSIYSDAAVPRSGSDVADAELSLLGGYAFRWRGQSHYVETRLGYRHRFDEELEDQLRFDIKAGLRYNDRWEFIPAITTIWAVDARKDPVFTEDGQNDFDLVKLEAMARYNLNHSRYLQFGGFSHVYGENVGDGEGVMLSAGFLF